VQLTRKLHSLQYVASRANHPGTFQEPQPTNEQSLSLLHQQPSTVSLSPFADPTPLSEATQQAYTWDSRDMSPDIDPMESQELPDHFKLHNLSNQGSAVASSKGSGHRHKTGTIRRYPTRRIKLIQGSVLSINYPVPSPIRNAIQPEYRDAEGELSEEFTQMRCESMDYRLRRHLHANMSPFPVNRYCCDM
jgi:chitin synthase